MEQLVNVRGIREQFHFDDFVGQERGWEKMKETKTGYVLLSIATLLNSITLFILVIIQFLA